MKKKKIKNKYMFGIFSLAIIAILGVGVAVASPLGKGIVFIDNSNLSSAEKTEMQAQMQAIQTAIDKKDFETWKSLMEAQLTEENFNKLVDANAKISEIKTVQEELKQAISDGDSVKEQELKAQLFDLMPQKNFGQRMHLKQTA